MSIRNAYESQLANGTLVEDEAQRRIVEHMAALQARLAANRGWLAGLRSRLSSRSGRQPSKGLYLWGGVGRGKTFLMDLFFSTLDTDRKRRIHFHRMMRDVHQRLGRIDNEEDPLDIVAADIADEVSVLCFDEFFVSDIGDAMILGRLLEGLFARGVTLVATSNSHPRDLYRNGLQRQRFMPAIEALERHTEVLELDGVLDYRLQLFQEAGTYLVPADDSAEGKLGEYFDGIATGDTRESMDIDILGRTIRARRCAKGVAWFEFDDICEGPRSQGRLHRNCPLVSHGHRVRHSRSRQAPRERSATIHCARR